MMDRAAIVGPLDGPANLLYSELRHKLSDEVITQLRNRWQEEFPELHFKQTDSDGKVIGMAHYVCYGMIDDMQEAVKGLEEKPLTPADKAVKDILNNYHNGDKFKIAKARFNLMKSRLRRKPVGMIGRCFSCSAQYDIGEIPSDAHGVRCKNCEDGFVISPSGKVMLHVAYNVAEMEGVEKL